MASTQVGMSAPDAADKSKVKTDHRVEREQEFRFEVEESDKIVIQLRTGFAEIFGTEMMKNREYVFYQGTKAAIFTWHGCSLAVEGKVEAYTSKETPMSFYLNLHGCLEQLRTEATNLQKKGPSVMICGPGDVGKSTLCNILLNYAVRSGRTPLSVDLDVGQGTIGIPGVMGLNVIEAPASVEGGFSQDAPLMYNFGSISPGTNMVLYEMLIGKLAAAAKAKSDIDSKVKSAGVIINTCGWVTGGGFKALLHAARAFEVDIVIVLDQEKLYNELVRELPNFVKVIFTPKSGGVVSRSREYRAESRDGRLREYFYGVAAKSSQQNTQFHPHCFDVPFQQMKIYKIGAPAVPDSCMPLGMKADDNQTKLVPIQPGHILMHHILALSFCSNSDKDQAVESNVQGFICVTGVDTDRQMLNVLSPQPKPLPTDCIFLLSEVQYVDST
ncbi:Polyribonucleotide 5'-hydroxyl-kinase Clp1 [Halotydeus destructor]|nr:Polyribonucleotide 5'-hydroxyl-kinase Clp1 [Halotydeus destructor]